MQQQPPNKHQIRLELPRDLDGKYSNAVVISQTQFEIVMDFAQIMPNDPRARVQSRVIMTPSSAKSFLQALGRNLEMFETKYGEIELPKRPPSLADQLFGVVKSGDNEDDTDTEEESDEPNE
jgi:hypothetical protein